MSAFEQITKLSQQIFKPKRLNTVVFFVTSVCNEKCRHCFYWEELNQKGDLTFEQIRRISETMPAIYGSLAFGRRALHAERAGRDSRACSTATTAFAG